MEARVFRVLCSVCVAPLLLLAIQSATHARSESSARQTRICIFDHATLRTVPGTCRPRAVAYPHSVRGRVRRAIYDSALTFGIPYTVLLKIAKCESSLNPRAVNGSHSGLFQFLPDTFRVGAQALHRETGIVARSYWNPLDASYVAGYLFATGKAPSWACEPPVG